MLDVRHGWWVGLCGGERAEMGWSRKRGGEPGLFVALLRGGVGLWSLWMGGRGERNGRLRCAVGALRGGGSGVGFGGHLLACLGQGAVLEPGLLRALEGGNAGWGRAFGLGFGFSLGCTADGNGSGGG